METSRLTTTPALTTSADNIAATMVGNHMKEPYMQERARTLSAAAHLTTGKRFTI